jgi:hypothetical protein
MTLPQSATVLLAALTLAASLTASADNLLPWRKIKLLNDPKTRLFIEGDKGKRQEIPGGIRQYFLKNEGGDLINLCKGRQQGNQLQLRCDRKGGMFDETATPQHQPWWWNYKAKIAGDRVIIYAIGQKDGAFDTGTEVEEHFFSED